MGRPKGSKNKAKTYASKEEVQLIIDEKLSEKEALMKELSIRDGMEASKASETDKEEEVLIVVGDDTSGATSTAAMV